MSLYSFFFFQAEDGIRDLVRSRGLGDVYKRQIRHHSPVRGESEAAGRAGRRTEARGADPESAADRLSLIHI